MVLVAANADHLVPVDVDEDAADRGANAAETTHSFHIAEMYSRKPRSMITFPECHADLRMAFPWGARRQPGDAEAVGQSSRTVAKVPTWVKPMRA